MIQILKSIFVVCLISIVGLSQAVAQNNPLTGPGGVLTVTPTVVNPGNNSSTTSIFNRQTTGGWGSTGWTGLGGNYSSGGSFSSSGGFRVGANFTSVGNSGSGISVGRNWVGGGTGSFGGFGSGGYNEQINAAACTLLGIPMGSFGALVMIFAGIIAIVSGALGAYKMALSTIVVGAGSWILFPIVQMFFPISC